MKLLTEMTPLLRRCWPAYPDWDYQEEFRDDRIYLDGIQQDGKWVAVAVVIVNNPLPELKYLCVDPDFRGQGLASTLLHRLQERFSFLYLEVPSNNTAARHLYEKHCFKVVQVVPQLFDSGSGLVMEWRR